MSFHKLIFRNVQPVTQCCVYPTKLKNKYISLYITIINYIYYTEELEDTKGVIIICISKIEEEQTTQWQKEKVQKDKQRSTKHRYTTKDQVTRTPLKIRGGLRYITITQCHNRSITRILVNTLGIFFLQSRALKGIRL